MKATGSAVRFAVLPGTRIADLDAGALDRLLERGRARDAAVARVVADIIDQVRTRGDEALLEMAARFDGVELAALEVPKALWQAALASLDEGVVAALRRAAESIRTFHAAQLPTTVEIEPVPGLVLGRRPEPLRRVGVYAPGGRAAYPSSVLMGVVPARVAGVEEVIVCSPPGPDGLPPAAVLAACLIGGADRCFAVGGAGAIAALAFGTQTLPRVDKIVGPGNAYVTEAKQQLNGSVGIDSPAGPSEILVLADRTADARMVAAELLAQAEHDPDASAVLVTTDPSLVEDVVTEIANGIASQPRRHIIETSLSANGALLLADNEADMFAFAERYAPEHLLVLTADPRAALESVRSAGTVFLGRHSSVAFGDYMTGANHTLPTAGLARVYSGLSTLDYFRFFTYQQVASSAAAAMAGPTVALAEAEGLPAHAAAAALRANGAAPDTPAPPRFRKAYEAIDLYDPGRVPTEIDLSDNTNLFGVPPAVEQLVREAPARMITRYPSVFAPDLKRALADLVGVEPANITTGCGSDDVIDSALRAFCEPGDRVALATPTFGVVATFARMNAAIPVTVDLREDLSLDVEGLLAMHARANYICRPNNPTGTSFARGDIERIADESRGIVLLDEAYADFADDDFGRDAARSRNIVSLRTLSKVYGLAGLRVGFAIGPADVITEIEKSRGPYKVNAFAEAAALAVVTRERAWIQDIVDQVRANRERLAASLARLGFDVLPSKANFLLIRLSDGRTAADTAVALRARGVAVRPFPALPRLGECIRVTVGPWSMMERFLGALATL